MQIDSPGHHAAAGHAPHSPHLTMQGTDIHDVSMHDLAAAPGTISESIQAQRHRHATNEMSAMPPPMTLDGLERQDSSNQQDVMSNSYFHKAVETVPTAFKWSHVNGNSPEEVYLTGSFNNWQGKILMYKQEDGEFALIIDIPRMYSTIHSFRLHNDHAEIHCTGMTLTCMSL